MLRALFIGFIVSAAMALAARLIVRWRFGGRGRDMRRLKPHGAVEYASFVLLIGAAALMTFAQRADGLESIVWPLAVLVVAIAMFDAYAVFLTQVFWTNEGIGAWDPIRKQRFIRWADVTKCRIRWHGTYLSDGRTTVGFAPWRDGADELKRFLEVRCATVLKA